MSDEFRIHLVDKKRVAILKSYTHTYLVRFVKTGKEMEIHKRFLKTIWPDRNKSKKKSKPKNVKPKNTQTKFNF